MKNKVLITGSNGQLGTCFKDVVWIKNSIYENCKYEYVFTTRKDFDISNKDMMRKYLSENKDIKIIINCAAYTDVKGAETEEGFKEALFINCECVKNLGELCKEFDIFLIHFGTDYMYPTNYYVNYPIKSKMLWEIGEDGFIKHYKNPNKYGQTKCFGVHELFKTFYDKQKEFKAPKFVVIVVSWLYSAYGNNFVKTIREKLETEEEINVVYSQVGSPTYAKDLANYVLDVIENDDCEFFDEVNNINKDKFNRIINFANLGVASWYDLAKSVEEVFSFEDKVKPILLITNDKVYRPKYSVLNTQKICERKGDKTYVRHWKDALYECLGLIRNMEKRKEKEN